MRKYKLFFFPLLIAILCVNTVYSQQNGYYDDFKKALRNRDKVKILDLSGKKLTNLSPKINVFTNLEVLKLGYNNLRQLPLEIIQLAYLREIDLRGNNQLRIAEVLQVLKDVVELRKLSLSDCRLSYLSKSIAELHKLKELDISDNDLNGLPFELTEIAGLRSINVAGNKIKEIDNIIYQCYKLEELDVSRNVELEMKRFWVAISFSKSLKSLTISKIGFLGDDIAQYLGIEKLVLTDKDQHSEIDFQLFEGTNFKEVVIKNSEGIDETELEKIISRLESVETLKINQNIEKLPHSISSLRNIRHLDLSGNNIEDIMGIKNLKTLNELNLQNNSVTDKDISKLGNTLPECNIYSDVTDSIQSSITPPLSTVNIPYRNETVLAENASRITVDYVNFNIPPNAFLNQKDSLVKGEVDIKVRTFDDPETIFIGGVPMNYDSAGFDYNLSSAGMFEFNAYQQGERLKPNPEREIQVNMLSEKLDSGYNVFSLKNDEWEDDGVSPIGGTIKIKKKGDVAYELPNDSLARASYERDSIEFWANYLARFIKKPPAFFYEKTILNVKKFRKDKTFTVNIEWLHSPETEEGEYLLPLYFYQRIFAKHSFYYEGDSMKQTYRDLKRISNEMRDNYKRLQTRKGFWFVRPKYEDIGPVFIKDLKLSANQNDDNFLLTINYEDSLLKIPCRIQALSQNPERVQKEYEKLYKKYKSANKIKNGYWLGKYELYDRRWEEIDISIKSLYIIFKDVWEQEKQRFIDRAYFLVSSGGSLPFEIPPVTSERKMTWRRFSLKTFGVVNVDKPRVFTLRVPERNLITPEFYDADGKDMISSGSYYLLDYSANSVRKYNIGEAFEVDSNSFRLVLVAPDERIAVVNKESVLRNRDGQKSKMVVKLNSVKGKGVENLISILSSSN